MFDAATLLADSEKSLLDIVLIRLESQICLPLGLRANRTLWTNCAVPMRDNANQ